MILGVQRHQEEMGGNCVEGKYEQGGRKQTAREIDQQISHTSVTYWRPGVGADEKGASKNRNYT